MRENRATLLFEIAGALTPTIELAMKEAGATRIQATIGFYSAIAEMSAPDAKAFDTIESKLKQIPKVISVYRITHAPVVK